LVVPVICISSAVHVYSTSIHGWRPKYTPIFFSYLSFFTGSMGLLVAFYSYILMFVGWELIGVASYLFIVFFGLLL
jgi:NADH:ubiquinone oxidoreductase subunit 5 (subunit L)/multisubunit Na+/H+ antiporter MnhA subunit